MSVVHTAAHMSLQNAKNNIHVRKNNISFNVSPNSHFVEWWTNTYPQWESATFVVLDKFLANEPDAVYVDIGAWIGPTTLYAAEHCRNVYAIEPDPVALRALLSNIDANEERYRSRIVVINKALDTTDGTTKFGGNGPLGNSMSTMIVREPCYEKGNSHGYTPATKTVDVQTISLPMLCALYPLISSATLMKMDIEGGEKYLLPHIAQFLRQNRIPLLISLHWCWLKVDDVVSVIDTIFATFDHIYVRDKTVWKKIANTETAITHRAEDCLCTFDEISLM